MEYSTLEHWQGISETGIIYDLGSLYDRFEQLGDPRKARGKRYSLVTLLVIIFLGKLCDQDSPVEIADWAQNHAEEIAGLLQLPGLQPGRSEMLLPRMRPCLEGVFCRGQECTI